MKNFISLINCNRIAYIFALLLMSSCEMTSDKGVEPQDKSLGGNASARKGEGTINSVPVGGCPDGYVWDNVKGECVRETPTYPDINPSTITFDESQSSFQSVQNTNATIKATPGSIIGGKQYWRHQIYVAGSPTNERLIIGVIYSSGYYYTDYYDIAGKHIGRVTVFNDDQFYSWQPSFTGTPDGSGFTSRGFIGGWGRCVAHAANEMVSGTAIGSLSLLACWVWSGPCAAAVGVACAVQAAGGVYN